MEISRVSGLQKQGTLEGCLKAVELVKTFVSWAGDEILKTLLQLSCFEMRLAVTRKQTPALTALYRVPFALHVWRQKSPP